jgi:hypothetical protein
MRGRSRTIVLLVTAVVLAVLAPALGTGGDAGLAARTGAQAGHRARRRS